MPGLLLLECKDEAGRTFLPLCVFSVSKINPWTHFNEPPKAITQFPSNIKCSKVKTLTWKEVGSFEECFNLTPFFGSHHYLPLAFPADELFMSRHVKLQHISLTPRLKTALVCFTPLLHAAPNCVVLSCLSSELSNLSPLMDIFVEKPIFACHKTRQSKVSILGCVAWATVKMDRGDRCAL